MHAYYSQHGAGEKTLFNSPHTIAVPVYIVPVPRLNDPWYCGQKYNRGYYEFMTELCCEWRSLVRTAKSASKDKSNVVNEVQVKDFDAKTKLMAKL